MALSSVWTVCELPDHTKSNDVKLILRNFEIDRPREENRLFSLWDINLFWIILWRTICVI